MLRTHERSTSALSRIRNNMVNNDLRSEEARISNFAIIQTTTDSSYKKYDRFYNPTLKV